MTLAALAAGGKAAVARALSAIEVEWRRPALTALLDEACVRPGGHVIGVTGPPGVGKSSLAGALLRHFRSRGDTVAVLAVDPSSQRSGGALLGDRARIAADPEDPGALIRSMAARDRLGGLSEHAFAACMLLRALYDRVIVESVGVGQSESDIRLAADTLLLCLQPGSGDGLQFMKAGIMELPDVIAVTKADLGSAAARARAQAEAALALAAPQEGRPGIFLVSVANRTGLDVLSDRLGSRIVSPDLRSDRAEAWLRSEIRAEFGRQGLALAEARGLLEPAGPPFGREARIFAALMQAIRPPKSRI